MNLGFGLSDMGFAPFGTGDVDLAPTPPTENLLDARGVQQSARAIDAATGQYILNADGRFQGMPRVQQLVLLRVRAMPAIGGDVTATLQQRLLTQLQKALADLVTAGLVQIIAVVGYLELPTRERLGLKWRDLTTGQELIEPL